MGIELNENAQEIVSEINQQGVLCKETQEILFVWHLH